MQRNHALLATILILPLAACGGGGSGGVGDTGGTGGTGGGAVPVPGNDNAALVARFDDAVILAEEVADLGQTTVLTMPTTGTATFEGIATGLFEVTPGNSANDVGILGDATLTADFAAGTITGTSTNFVSVNRDDLSNDQVMTGTVTFDGGTFGGPQVSVVTGQFNGTLTDPGLTVVVDDPGLGAFRGNGADAVAIQTSEDGTISVNGDELTGSFGFSARQ